MFDSVGYSVAMALDVLLERTSGEWQRTMSAYRAAFRETDGSPTPENLPLLREQFKRCSAPGAYDDPDGWKLAPWIEAWSRGASPREARRSVRRHPGQSWDTAPNE